MDADDEVVLAFDLYFDSPASRFPWTPHSRLV
jgi:hypothetical protein